MRPTEELRNEHEAIKLVLKILENICKRMEAGETANPQHLEQIIDFIKVFVDKCHHGKEEDLLFPAMEEMGIPREGGPIVVMLREHTLGRGYVQSLSEAVAGYSAGDRGRAHQVIENARNYVALLTQHIEKENNVLFPMMEIRLSKSKEAELSEGFERIENERIGPGKHEEFHKLLDHLAEVYLK